MMQIDAVAYLVLNESGETVDVVLASLRDDSKFPPTHEFVPLYDLGVEDDRKTYRA